MSRKCVLGFMCLGLALFAITDEFASCVAFSIEHRCEIVFGCLICIIIAAWIQSTRVCKKTAQNIIDLIGDIDDNEDIVKDDTVQNNTQAQPDNN